MGQEITVPDWAKQRPAAAFASLNPAEDSLSDGIGQGYPVIGYKGKNWSFRYRGERKDFIRADDGTPAGYLDVVILGQAKTKSKSYYAKWDPTSDGGRPVCSSIDGVQPDPDVTTKQCDTCVLCPRNVWKVDPQTGRKGRECTDYKRLAVLVLPSQTNLLYPGAPPLLEPAFLRVPPASLNSLSIMGDTMRGQGFHYSSFITRITFEASEAHPKMVFRPQQPLSDAEGPMILKLRGDMQVDRIIHGGFQDGLRSLDNGGATFANSQPTGLMELQANHSTPAPSTTPAPAPTNPAPNGHSNVVGFAPPATTAPPRTLELSALSAREEEPKIVSTGLGGVTAAPTTAPVSNPVAPTPAANDDTGAPEATDDDLDAMIAKQLARK